VRASFLFRVKLTHSTRHRYRCFGIPITVQTDIRLCFAAIRFLWSSVPPKQALDLKASNQNFQK